MIISNQPVLFYDGSCGFCQRSVQFVLNHERDASILFTPLQSEFAQNIIRQNKKLEHVDSIIFMKGNDIFIESDAAIALSLYMKIPYRYGKVVRYLPKVVRDQVYRFLAKHRHRFIRGTEACLLPTPEQRKRFIHS